MSLRFTRGASLTNPAGSHQPQIALNPAHQKVSRIEWYSGRPRFAFGSFPFGGVSAIGLKILTQRVLTLPLCQNKRDTLLGASLILVLRTGFEPAIFAVRGRCPNR